jgi:hypothetical protein
LDLSTRPAPTGQAGFLFTASGRHPDATSAVKRLAGEYDPCAVITTNPAEPFRALCERLGVQVIDLESPAGKDGFLATNSLIMSAVVIARAVTGEDAPADFPALRVDHRVPVPLEEVLILFPPGLVAVAIDIEARLNETGLAAAQIADYRNFTHGRHHGLARRAGSVTVFALIDDQCRTLAERTLELLPKEIPQVRLESPRSAPWDTIDLLVASIGITATVGEAVGLDAGRPRVPEFGRRLYRLRVELDEGATRVQAASVRFKLRELGVRSGHQVVVDEYQVMYADWLQKLRRASFLAIVLDYDGTAVTTEGRYELPSENGRKELDRFLAADGTIGFASGRGDSLHEDLRRWVEERHWPQVHLGLTTARYMFDSTGSFPNAGMAIPRSPPP